MTTQRRTSEYTDGTLAVRKPGDLDALFSIRRSRIRRVALAIYTLEQEERTYWEHRINRYNRACGCETGAATMVLSLVAYGIYLSQHAELLERGPGMLAGVGVAIVVTGAVVGKALGLLYARARLRGAIASLRQRVNPE